jgi:hypothetical protein
MIQSVTTNWRTTTLGLLGFGVTLITAIMAQIDLDPETVPDWTAVVTTGIMMAGLLRARDDVVTSRSMRL